MIEWLTALPGWLVVLVLGASIVVESGLLVGLVLPGTTAVVAMGVVAGLGVVPAQVAYLVAVAAAVAGPSIGWRVGRVGGPALRTSTLGRRIPEATWRSAERVVATRGRRAVALGQLVVGARTLVPLLVGMSPAPYARFALVSVPAATVWAALLTTAGHLAGASYQVLTDALGSGTVAVAVVAVVVVGLGLAGRFVAGQPQWGLLPAGDERQGWPARVHAAVDRVVTARVGARRAPGVTAVLWWLVAVLSGLVTCAAVVWAVQRSTPGGLDRATAEWVGRWATDNALAAARVVDGVLAPSNVLGVAYVVTAVVVVRRQGDVDRPWRQRAVTTSLGLAALAVSSEWVASFVRARASTTGSAADALDLQVAVVPCALVVAVVLLAARCSRPTRVLAWTVAGLLTAAVVTARLLLETMTLSQVVESLAVAAAWAALLVGVLGPVHARPNRHAGGVRPLERLRS